MTFANNQRRALVLGSYPCVTPVHGGQIRLAEIINAYRQAGYAVQSINLYEMQPQPRGDHDFDFPPDTPWRLWHEKHVPLIADLNSGRYAAGDPVAYKKTIRRRTRQSEHHPPGTTLASATCGALA